MDSLRDTFAEIEAQEKTLEVYTSDDAAVSELAEQFSTHNVEVVGKSIAATDEPGFVVVKDADEFRGAIGIDHLQTILSPEVGPPWTLDDRSEGAASVLDFLDDTIFTSYDRRQLLAVTREIEERAWRTGAGTLYVGFQNSEALAAQASVYDRMARERDLTVRIVVDDEWEREMAESIRVVTEAGDEIGRFWFVLFDGGPSRLNASGLLAEERESDRFYGFWTDDRGRVRTIITYLEATYDLR